MPKRGNFIYSHAPGVSADDLKREELGRAVAADGARAFDVTTVALGEGYELRSSWPLQRRGKVLKIETYTMEGAEGGCTGIASGHQGFTADKDILTRRHHAKSVRSGPRPAGKRHVTGRPDGWNTIDLNILTSFY